MEWYFSRYLSPFAPFYLASSEDYLFSLSFSIPEGAELRPNSLLQQAAAQLDAYFSGQLQSFSIPLAPQGTPHQKQIWLWLAGNTPYGQVCSYQDLAHALHSSPRAVGQAMRHNPLPLFIPCHRVLSSSRKLQGYSLGGLQVKSYLLQLEGYTHFSP